MSEVSERLGRSRIVRTRGGFGVGVLDSVWGILRLAIIVGPAAAR